MHKCSSAEFHSCGWRIRFRELKKRKAACAIYKRPTIEVIVFFINNHILFDVHGIEIGVEEHS